MQVVLLDSFGTMLKNMLSTIFNSILAPVLRDVFDILQNIYMQLFQDMFYSLLLKLFTMLLKFIGFMESVFNVFSGVSNVKVDNVSMPIIQYFFELGTVQKVFGAVTIIAVVLAFMTTIFAVIKSMSDMALEDKTPLSTVLQQALKASVTFVIIPISCLFILHMTTQVMLVFNTVFKVDAPTSSISDTLFVSVADQAKKSGTNIDEYKSGQKFMNMEDVKKDFDVNKIDFLSAYLALILIAFILLSSIIQFIQRLLIIILLYIVSPFFVSYIPLDGGAKFKGWRDLFVAHMLSAFGPIICMKLYLLLVPVITGKIDFGVTGTVLTCVRLVFIVGGAFAVYRARFLFISIINTTAAGHMEASGFLTSLIVGSVSKKASSVGRKKAVNVQRPSGQQAGGSKGSASAGSSSQSQAYTGK